MNTTDFSLIQDIDNSLAQQTRQTTDLMKYMFRQSGQVETAEAAKIGEQTETMQTDRISTLISYSPVHSVSPKPQGIPSRLVII